MLSCIADPIRYLFDAIPSGPSRELQGEEIPYGINMVKALDVSDEFVENRKVCVIDTGYDLNHEDLPKLNVGGNNNVGNLWSSDGNGHGSHCVGTIAAVENGVGVVGVNRNGKLGLHIQHSTNFNIIAYMCPKLLRKYFIAFVRNSLQLQCQLQLLLPQKRKLQLLLLLLEIL